LYIANQEFIDSFKTNWSVLQDFWNVVSSFVDAGVAKHEHNALGTAVNEAHFSLKNCYACSFAPDQSPRDVEAPMIIRQQLVKIVARHPARNVRIIFIDQLCISCA